MSRIDDVRELAEKVMGWKTQFHSKNLWKFDWLEFSSGDNFVACYGNERSDTFDPFTNANAALEVVEAVIKKTGYRILVGNDGESYCAMFRDEAGGFRDFDGEGTFCEAVCTAALAAIRSK